MNASVLPSDMGFVRHSNMTRMVSEFPEKVAIKMHLMILYLSRYGLDENTEVHRHVL